MKVFFYGLPHPAGSSFLAVISFPPLVFPPSFPRLPDLGIQKRSRTLIPRLTRLSYIFSPLPVFFPSPPPAVQKDSFPSTLPLFPSVSQFSSFVPPPPLRFPKILRSLETTSPVARHPSIGPAFHPYRISPQHAFRDFPFARHQYSTQKVARQPTTPPTHSTSVKSEETHHGGKVHRRISQFAEEVAFFFSVWKKELDLRIRSSSRWGTVISFLKDFPLPLTLGVLFRLTFLTVFYH